MNADVRTVPESKWKTVFLLSTVIALLCYLYGITGNSQDVSQAGSSTILWIVHYWNTPGADFSYGWIIPFVSMGIVLLRRREIIDAPKSGHWAGLVFIVLLLTAHWFGFRTQQTRISLLSLFGLLWAIPLYLYGWQTAKILAFPCAYLIFCIPPSLLDTLTVPLRLMTSAISAGVLNGLGISAVRQGTLIFSAGPDGFRLGVDDPCSGLRSLMAIAALTSVYAYSLHMAAWKKIVLFISALPLAIAGNVIRVISVAIVAGTLGQEKAMGFYHDYSGYVVFVAAILLTMGVGWLLERLSTEGLRKWIRVQKDAPSS